MNKNLKCIVVNSDTDESMVIPLVDFNVEFNSCRCGEVNLTLHRHLNADNMKKLINLLMN